MLNIDAVHFVDVTAGSPASTTTTAAAVYAVRLTISRPSRPRVSEPRKAKTIIRKHLTLALLAVTDIAPSYSVRSTLTDLPGDTAARRNARGHALRRLQDGRATRRRGTVRARD
jgi:hypothetical protein